MSSRPVIGIVWRDGPAAQGKPLPENSRLYPIALALLARGMDVAALPYCEEARDTVGALMKACAGLLVWVDPLSDGRDRSDLDALLRDASRAGVWVSAHPDTILKMGTKDILFRTRHLSWGGDTVLYATPDDLRREFPTRLTASGCRVLKRYRGNGGQGVWRVTLAPGNTVRLQEATDRDATTSAMTLEAFLDHCASYFDGDGRLIDQAFQPRIAEGMVRCYMSGSELVGFARQHPAAGVAADAVFGLPAAKTMLPPDAPQFAALRAQLEREWTPGLCETLALAPRDLPALWDADFLFGPRHADGSDSYVLCEINISCVTPFPPQAPPRIAETVARALGR